MGHIPDMTETSDGHYTYTHVGWLGNSVPMRENKPRAERGIRRWFGLPASCSPKVSRKIRKILAHLINFHVPVLWLGSHDCEMCGASTKWNENAEIGGNGEVFFPADAETNRIYTSPTMILHYILDHGYVPPDEFCSALIRWWESDHATPCRKGKCRPRPSIFYQHDCLPATWTKDKLEVYSGPTFFEQNGSISTVDALRFIYKTEVTVVRGHEAEVEAEIQRWSFCPGNPKHPGQPE